MSLLPLTITLRTITPHAIYLRLTSHFRFFATHLTLLVMSINQSINENFLSTPSRSPFRRAPTKTKWKRTLFRIWWNWEQAPFGCCFTSKGKSFQVVGPTTEKERLCTATERANGITKSPWAEDHSVRRYGYVLHKLLQPIRITHYSI